MKRVSKEKPAKKTRLQVLEGAVEHLQTQAGELRQAHATALAGQRAAQAEVDKLQGEMKQLQQHDRQLKTTIAHLLRAFDVIHGIMEHSKPDVPTFRVHVEREIDFGPLDGVHKRAFDLERASQDRR